MFEGAEIEHADAAVGAAGGKDIDGPGHEADVVDFLVVCDKLGFSGQRGDVPDGAGGVDGGGDDESWRNGVPIEGCEGGGEVGGFGVGEEGERCEFLRGLVIVSRCYRVGGGVGGAGGKRPQSQMVTGCRKQISKWLRGWRFPEDPGDGVGVASFGKLDELKSLSRCLRVGLAWPCFEYLNLWTISITNSIEKVDPELT